MRTVFLACLLLASCGSETKNATEGSEVFKDVTVPGEAGSGGTAAAATSAKDLSYAAVPTFDARRVCDPIANIFANSEPHNVDPACYAEEIAAKKALSKMRLPEPIVTYCEQIASLRQGGYSKFKECVDEKLANEATLSRIEAESGS